MIRAAIFVILIFSLSSWSLEYWVAGHGLATFVDGEWHLQATGWDLLRHAWPLSATIGLPTLLVCGVLGYYGGRRANGQVIARLKKRVENAEHRAQKSVADDRAALQHAETVARDSASKSNVARAAARAAQQRANEAIVEAQARVDAAAAQRAKATAFNKRRTRRVKKLQARAADGEVITADDISKL